MQDKLIIVTLNKDFVEYAKVIGNIAKSKNIPVELYTIDEYKNLTTMADIAFKDTKIVFIGTNNYHQSAMSDIISYQYDKFGCRIGWKDNKCTLFVYSGLSAPTYQKFLEYCRGMRLKHNDVIIPTDKFLAQKIENVKKIFASNDNNMLIRAQYCTLIYEFIDHYFDAFLSEEGEDLSYDDDVPLGLKDLLQDLKTNALKNITKKQMTWCHGIIHSAAVTCGTIGAVPILIADSIPITGTQVSMVIGLGKVFENKITKSDAQVLLKTVAAPLAGRALAKAGLVLVPGVGWAVNGAIAAAITEILGWTIANDFAVKEQKQKLIEK